MSLAAAVTLRRSSIISRSLTTRRTATTSLLESHNNASRGVMFKNSSISSRDFHSSAPFFKPTMEQAKSLKIKVSEMDNDQLTIMSACGVEEAEVEVLIRHIMSVDGVEYDEAVRTFTEIETEAKRGIFLVTLPYKVGIFTAVAAGLGSIPMVFDFNIAHAFNEAFVTIEVPEPQDVDTFFEVGAWTWSWMEPILGTASFTLLTLQFARSQIMNLGIKPFTNFTRDRNAKRVVSIFKKYDAGLLYNFVKDIAYYQDQSKK